MGKAVAVVNNSCNQPLHSFDASQYSFQLTFYYGSIITILIKKIQLTLQAEQTFT